MTTHLTTEEQWSAYWGGRRRTVRCARPQARMLATLLDRVGPDPGRVLELGCAPGEMIVRMAGLRPQHEYHGLDYSADGLEAARALTAGLAIPVTLHLGDLREVELEDRYDLVASFGLIEHFTDPLPVLRDHARLARPGGWVAVSVPNYSHAVCQWFIRRLDPGALETHSLEIMSTAALDAALRAAGLEGVEVGEAGGPKVRTSCKERTLVRRAVRSLARAWNGASRILPPGLGWRTTLWGMGRVVAAPPPG